MPSAPTISLIIPCWNDAAPLHRLLPPLANLPDLEILLADASTTPGPADFARQLGAKVISCPQPHRGRQLNAGAAAATGDVLLFQHADVELTAVHLDSLRRSMADHPRAVGGAFHRFFDPSHTWRRRFLTPLVRWRNQHGGTLWGDQSVFVRRDHFNKLGGFAGIPLMEDVEFSKRLRRSGRVLLLDPPVLASARRHRRKGALRVSLLNLAFIALYKLGVSPHTLHRWYYGKKAQSPEQAGGI